ncbi:hypothetical protein QFC22_002066 [Naganishia vaughanmartiniae]|uniref:Uncharacterized protein n=1 Tax=Naganishia vaughanmartiniae TaxID=1424756 RepID=A0ACC2XHA0_9TREE|nr:hypothetical protein QFC22_002066 [Naganishia vaughanmartiniae]
MTRASLSPVDMVHQLGVFVHGSPRRMDAFERVRAVQNPETPKGLLPLKDVVTRWNSKEAAISRVLRLRKTIEAYTARQTANNCPIFTRATFNALAIVQPSLKIFLDLTQVYQEVGSNAHRILADLVHAVDEIRDLHDRPFVSTTRKQSSKQAIDKLQKYIKKMLKNKWVTAAFAFDPTVRNEGLFKLLTEAYSGKVFYERTVKFISDRMSVHQAASKGRAPAREDDEVQLMNRPKRPNKFASARYKAGEREIRHDVSNPWECYNSEEAQYATFEGEHPLAYWKRMAQFPEMRPLAYVARDVLGLACSSASVERLFSHAGYVLGKRRGSLSARLLGKQVALRMWEMQGYLTADDLGRVALIDEPADDV